MQHSRFSRKMPLVPKPSLALPYPLSKTFFAASTTLLTSCPPFSTTFSIAVPAFFSSSGLAALPSCKPRSFFCCFARASFTAAAALSPTFEASAPAALRDSAVGGGMLRIRRSGLVPVGSGWGVRERSLDWIAEEMGLMCCEDRLAGVSRRVLYRARELASRRRSFSPS